MADFLYGKAGLKSLDCLGEFGFVCAVLGRRHTVLWFFKSGLECFGFGLVIGKINLMMETPLLVFNHWGCNIGVNDVNRILFSISGKNLIYDEHRMVTWLLVAGKHLRLWYHEEFGYAELDLVWGFEYSLYWILMRITSVYIGEVKRGKRNKIKYKFPKIYLRNILISYNCGRNCWSGIIKKELYST